MSVYVSKQAFQACIAWPPACFQYSLLLDGDYPASVWLLSAFDWKLENPEKKGVKTSWTQCSPPPLNSHQPLREPAYVHTSVFLFVFFYE